MPGELAACQQRSTVHGDVNSVGQGSQQTNSTKFRHFSRTFKDPNCIFQAPKLSTKSHILDADVQNLDCNVTLKCTVLYSPILFPSTGDMHISACFKIVNKCKISKFARFKFKDFSRIFKYFQAPYLFSSTFKGLEFFIPNSSIFKDFSSTL